MQIVANSGKTFDAAWILDTETRDGTQQLTIQMPGNTDLHDMISDLVGADTVTCIKGNAKTVYEGYTLLGSIIYSANRSIVRLTLERK